MRIVHGSLFLHNLLHTCIMLSNKCPKNLTPPGSNAAILVGIPWKKSQSRLQAMLKNNQFSAADRPSKVNKEFRTSII